MGIIFLGSLFYEKNAAFPFPTRCYMGVDLRALDGEGGEGRASTPPEAVPIRISSTFARSHQSQPSNMSPVIHLTSVPNALVGLERSCKTACLFNIFCLSCSYQIMHGQCVSLVEYMLRTKLKKEGACTFQVEAVMSK